MHDDAESLIAHLANALAPVDRDAFRRAAESALATSPECCGEGTTYRLVVPVWRAFFNPPTMEDRPTAWESRKKRLSKLVTEGAKDGHRARRIRIVK